MGRRIGIAASTIPPSYWASASLRQSAAIRHRFPHIEPMLRSWLPPFCLSRMAHSFRHGRLQVGTYTPNPILKGPAHIDLAAKEMAFIGHTKPKEYGVLYPFRPVSLTPSTKYRWRNTNTINTGITITVATAIK